jgi:tripeptide aminopeptidase
MLRSAPSARVVSRLMDDADVREAVRFFFREKAWTLEKQLEICSVPAPTFFEEKRAAVVVEQLRNLGWYANVDRAGNVIATIRKDDPRRMVALTAHLDTVLAPRNGGDIRLGTDGRLLGPGVADNGAGLAALLTMARAFRLNNLVETSPRGLMLVANVGEEGEGNLSGMRYLCRQGGESHRIDSFVVLDGPGAEHITTQALGSKRYEITLEGPGGHSWSDAGTANPVHALARLVHRFTEEHAQLAPGRARSSVNFGVIEGGSSINAIPSDARTKIDMRSESSFLLEELAERLTACIEETLSSENRRATSGRLKGRLREIGSRPGGMLPADSPLLAVMRCVDAHLGIVSRMDCASTDANIPLSLGMEAVCIGAGGSGGGAHSANEWFLPEGRETALQRIYLALALLLRAEA